MPDTARIPWTSPASAKQTAHSRAATRAHLLRGLGRTGIVLLALAACLLAYAFGPVASGWEAFSVWSRGDAEALRLQAILWHLRVPRVLLAMGIGASLAAAGAALQGLFRNPLADPGLIGITAGGSVAVVLALAMVSLGWISGHPLLLIAFGFPGALLAVWGAYKLGSGGRSEGSTATLLLAGVGINALAFAATGFLLAVLDDQSLRNFSFWTLGSLSGARWSLLLPALPLLLLPPILLAGMGKSLNLMALGEGPAAYAGLSVHRLRRKVLVLVALCVAASVALGGAIGFIGLVTPHMVRPFTGPDHRRLIPVSAAVGAVLLLLADALARSVLPPQEVPVGVLTAGLGTPVFLHILRSARGRALNRAKA
jgi:iron complex transport system permease protein